MCVSDHTYPSLALPHSSAAAAVVTPSVVSLQNRGNTGMAGDKRGISGSKDPAVSAKEGLSDDTSLLPPNKVQRQLDNLDQANAEIERLRKMGDKISGELQGRINLFFTLWFQLENMFQLIGTPQRIEQVTCSN